MNVAAILNGSTATMRILVAAYVMAAALALLLGATETMPITFLLAGPALPGLAALLCAIGLGFLTGVGLRLAAAAVALYLFLSAFGAFGFAMSSGTALPMTFWTDTATICLVTAVALADAGSRRRAVRNAAVPA